MMIKTMVIVFVIFFDLALSKHYLIETYDDRGRGNRRPADYFGVLPEEDNDEVLPPAPPAPPAVEEDPITVEYPVAPPPTYGDDGYEDAEAEEDANAGFDEPAETETVVQR